MQQKIVVLIYSKPGCRLCDEMKEELARANCNQLYSLHEINIETDPVLFEKYRYDIPVLLIDGVEAFRHRLRAEQFREKIREGVRHH